jgi:uncharacterized membrane protein YeaQ/YmgE (transglycosylase-associated protein family)
MSEVYGLVEAVVGLLFLAAIPVCFLKGRRAMGWFGAVAYVVGAVVWFPLFRHFRAEGDDHWMWLVRVVGLVVALVVIAVALRPARKGSYWQRRDTGSSGPVLQ